MPTLESQVGEHKEGRLGGGVHAGAVLAWMAQETSRVLAKQ